MWARPGNKLHAYPSSSFSPCARAPARASAKRASSGPQLPSPPLPYPPPPRVLLSFFHSVIYSGIPALIYISLYQCYYLASPAAYFQRQAAVHISRSFADSLAVTGIVGGSGFSLSFATGPLDSLATRHKAHRQSLPTDCHPRRKLGSEIPSRMHDYARVCAQSHRVESQSGVTTAFLPLAP